MITHKDLANLVAELYNPASTYKWIYRSDLDANVHMGITIVEDFFIVVTRGSFDEQDWIHDFQARWIIPTGKPKFGRVHAGSYFGTPEAWDLIKALYNKANEINTVVRTHNYKLVFAGHSLGGGRPNELALHAVLDDIIPYATVAWGEPAFMFPEGNALLSGVKGWTYQNVSGGGSLVDNVTKWTLPIGYRIRVPVSKLIQPTPKVIDLLDLFVLHHFNLYQAVTPEISL